MADFGADVIKVEQPEGGDPFRALGPYHNGEAMRWAAMGRNKRCITLDLRKKKGKELCLELIKKSDVVIENFRTGTWTNGVGFWTRSGPTPRSSSHGSPAMDRPVPMRLWQGLGLRRLHFRA